MTREPQEAKVADGPTASPALCPAPASSALQPGPGSLRVAVVNLGCKVNRVESDSIAASYLARGARLVPVPEADLVVVNTCTVTGPAEKKTRKAVRGVLKDNGRARVLVTGCAAAIDPAFYENLDPRIAVVPKAELMEEACAGVDVELGAKLRSGAAFPARAGVKVQDGCNHACTYCIVHVARGRAWSRPLDQVKAEVASLARNGVAEVVLTGIDLGSYRHDGQGLEGLLEALLAVCGPARLRISSVEPRSLTPAVIELMARHEGRICRHLHLPLQSGSSKVLSEMDRPYDAQAYLDLCARVRAALPQVSLTTDIIAGFPGETEEDFRETLEAARAAAFSKIHEFRYSRRTGTPAAARPDQVPDAVMDERVARLRELSDRLRQDDARARIGSTEAIAVEGAGWGTSESYHKVRLPEGLETGTLVSRTIIGCDEQGALHA